MHNYCTLRAGEIKYSVTINLLISMPAVITCFLEITSTVCDVQNNAAFKHLCRWYSLHLLLINFSHNLPFNQWPASYSFIIVLLFFCFSCPSPLYLFSTAVSICGLKTF